MVLIEKVWLLSWGLKEEASASVSLQVDLRPHPYLLSAQSAMSSFQLVHSVPATNSY